MPTYLVRWPNGTLSIAAADDIKELSHELMKDEVCTEEEMDSPHGMIIEMPKGFRLHFEISDEVDLQFVQGFSFSTRRRPLRSRWPESTRRTASG